MKPGSQLLCIILLAACPGLLMADEPTGDPIQGYWIPPELLLRRRVEIGLTDQQIEKIRSLMSEAGPIVEQHQQRLDNAMGRIARLLGAASVDEDAALKQLDEILENENEVRRRHLRVMIQIRNTLTAEQQERAVTLRQRVQDRKRLEQRLQAKMTRIEQEIQSRAQAGASAHDLINMLQKFTPLMEKGQVKEAEALLDQLLERLDVKDLAKSDSDDKTQLDQSHRETDETQLREIIVSHTDENDILQLYHIKEDGSSRRQITTHSKHGCMMPAVSPDGSRIVYVQQSEKGMALWITDFDGKNSKALTELGRNLLPCWLPDSEHIVWMLSSSGKDPAENSQLHIMSTETMDSRRLFSDAQQIKFSNSMAVVSPNGRKVAFVSNRSGSYRVWVSNLDGSDARPISPTSAEHDALLKLPIEQKVPAWSPDGKWIAHWEGVEMIHMSKFTGIQNQARDKLISETWNVWVVGCDGKNKRNAGRGDDPTWSPDGFVTRSFPDPQKGGPKIMVETKGGWKDLPIVPARTQYGRFAWIPQTTFEEKMKEGGLRIGGKEIGLKKGDRIPSFEAADQSGKTRSFNDLCGPKGLLCVIYRSAHW